MEASEGETLIGVHVVMFLQWCIDVQYLTAHERLTYSFRIQLIQMKLIEFNVLSKCTWQSVWVFNWFLEVSAAIKGETVCQENQPENPITWHYEVGTMILHSIMYCVWFYIVIDLNGVYPRLLGMMVQCSGHIWCSPHEDGSPPNGARTRLTWVWCVQFQVWFSNYYLTWTQ